jgi:hypothetical protein
VRKQILLAAFAAYLILPATAFASWGEGLEGHCGPGNAHHCYVVEEWVMSGVEKIEGASAYIETKSANVADWSTNGGFLDNEMWLGFNGTEKYTEVGQTAGGNGFILEPENELFERNCCSLHAFWSYAIAANNWYDYAAPWTEPGSTWNLYQISGQSHNGTWCDYFTTTQAWCKAGFPTWGTWIEVGAEYASASEPENRARSGVNAWWEGTAHNWQHSEEYHALKLCQKPTAYHGDFEWWTCP